MNLRSKVLLLLPLLAVAADLLSQTASLNVQPNNFAYNFYFKGAVPSTPTALCEIGPDGISCTTGRSVWIRSLVMTNTAASPAVCTIQDGNGVKLYADSIGATGSGNASLYVMVLPNYPMPGGITWSCTTSNVNAVLQYSY